MPDGEFDWGGRLRKGIGGAQRFQMCIRDRYKIVQGSQIEVIQQKPDGLIIGVQEARIAMSREVADRIKV